MLFGLSDTDAENLRSGPRWRLTLRPKDEAGSPPAQSPGIRNLPPRVLTLSHIHELGTRLATAIGAQEPYQLRLDNGSTSRTVAWTELRTVIPEDLTPLTLTATGHLLDHPANSPEHGTHNQQAEITLFDNRGAYLRVSGSPQSLDDQYRYTTIAESLAAYFAGLGRPRRDWAWLIPALFWIGVAVAGLPVIWLIAVGRLPWQAAPFLAATGYVAAAYLSEQVGRWADRRTPRSRASLIDTRPIEEIRRELEAQRQKRRITWITALITGPITAVLGALLAFLLQK